MTALALQSTELTAQTQMDVPSTKAVLEAIQTRAIAKWGDKKWRAELARETVKIMNQLGDTDATYYNRRRQLYRAFEEWGCSSDTLFTLAAAVGCRFQMVCTETKVIDF